MVREALPVRPCSFVLFSGLLCVLVAFLPMERDVQGNFAIFGMLQAGLLILYITVWWPAVQDEKLLEHVIKGEATLSDLFDE